MGALIIRVYPALSEWCVEIASVPDITNVVAPGRKTRMLARDYADLGDQPGVEELSAFIHEALQKVEGYAGDTLDDVWRVTEPAPRGNSRPSRPAVGAAHRARLQLRLE